MTSSSSSPPNNNTTPPQNPLSKFLLRLATNIIHYFPLIDGLLFMLEFYFIIAMVGMGMQMLGLAPGGKVPRDAAAEVDMHVKQQQILEMNQGLSSSSSQNGTVTGTFQEVLFKQHLIPILFALFKHALWIFCVTRWFLWRHSVRLRRRFRLSLSKTAYVVILSCIIGFAWMVLSQYLLNNWIYSLHNWKDYPYERIVLFLLGSPILEELLMRVILTMVFRRRTGDSVLWTVLYTNFCFSAMHLWNQLSHASDIFTFLQCIIAFVIGCYYSTRYFVTGNVFEVIVLHFANNLSGMFVPLVLTWEDIYPDFIVPILMTLLVYVYFLYQDSQYIMRGESVIKPRWVKERQKKDKEAAQLKQE